MAAGSPCPAWFSSCPIVQAPAAMALVGAGSTSTPAPAPSLQAPLDSSNGKGSQACFSPVFDLELDAKLGSSSNLDRCFSQQQLGSELQGQTSLLQQMLTLCRCSSPVQAQVGAARGQVNRRARSTPTPSHVLPGNTSSCFPTYHHAPPTPHFPPWPQLLQQLQRLRSAACAGSPNSSSTAGGLLSGGSGHSDDAAACVLAHDTPCSGPFGVVLDEAGLDVEAMACELLAGGYLVQVRDGAQQQERNKTPRSCLQNLRHRYIVCLGVRSAGDGEPAYLPEPLVVEPRFREQFTIAHPTPAYEALLQVSTASPLSTLAGQACLGRHGASGCTPSCPELELRAAPTSTDLGSADCIVKQGSGAHAWPRHRQQAAVSAAPPLST